MLTPEELDEISALLPVAARARRSKSPATEASERVSALLAHAHARGASVRALADQTGLSYHSVARRIRIRTGSNISPRKTAPEPGEEKGPVAREDTTP